MQNIGMVAKQGYKYIFAFGVLFLLSLALGACQILFFALFALCVFWFRNPERALGSDDEYADYPRVADCGELPLRDAADYYSIGKHLERGQLGSVDSAAWIAETLRALQPLYEACHP